MNRFIVLMAVLVMAVGSGVATGQELSPGDPAPPFDQPGSDGKNHSLADYAGRTVVLAMLPRLWQAVVRSAAPKSSQSAMGISGAPSPPAAMSRERKSETVRMPVRSALKG